MTALDDFRKQHPQYNDMADRDLADALHGKYYSDIPKTDFYKSLGMTEEDRSQWGIGEKINNVINQIGTGAYKGLTGLAGLPGTLSDMGAAMDLPRRVGGAPQDSPNHRTPPPPNQSPFPSGADLMGMLERNVPGFKAAPVETTADKYLQAGGQGASSIFLPGGALPNFVGGVAGSEASEAAGDLTKGTKAEPYARIAAALLGGWGGSFGANKLAASNVEQLVAKATADYNPDEWLAAIKLQGQAAEAGAPITSAEAMAQVKNGNRTLMSIQRTTEQMPQTERQMSQFMAGRPEGNQAALSSQLDNLAAQRGPEIGQDIQALGRRYLENTHGPTIANAEQRALQAERNIGPQMTREEAGGVIQQNLRSGADDADAYRAGASAPQYTAARSSDAVVNTDDVTAVTARYMQEEKGRLQDLAQQALATMRVGGRIAGAPDTSVTGLMASRKALGDMISAESRAGNNEAVRMLTDIRGRLDDALSQVPDVARANDTFSLLSREVTDRYAGPTVSPIVERDQYGRNLVMPPEQVPGKITQGGGTGVDEFTNAANRPAYDAYRNYLSHEILTKATGANGRVDAAALRKILNQNEEILNRFPEIRTRFSDITSAQAQVDEARNILSEAERTPIGSFSQTDDWKKQVSTILDDSPGAERRAAEMVRALSSAEEGGSQRVAELLRMKLEDTFNKSLSNSKGTMEQFRGANFAGVLEKNPQTLKSLEATIKALPNGETQWMGMRRLLDVFEAQGQRLLPGSPTSFNQQLGATLGDNLGKGVKSFGTDLWANWNVQRRSTELARILTAPEGVALLRRLAVEGPNSARAQQLVQGFYQGGQAGRSLEKTP